MLFNILPLATERLRCDAVATREKVVTLFTKLFAATRYDYAGHYLEWVERLRDTEPAIRARMASLALKVIETRPQLRADLLRHVAKCSATPPTTSASRPSTLLRLHVRHASTPPREAPRARRVGRLARETQTALRFELGDLAQTKQQISNSLWMWNFDEFSMGFLNRPEIRVPTR